MKRILVLSMLALAANAFGQTANSGASAGSTSGAQSGATAVGGGLATINTGNTTARGGNANSAGGNAAVTINMTDPSAGSSGTGTNGTLSPQGTTVGSGGDPYTTKSEIKTVGNPGAMSLATAFSQFNCANSAGVGAGWLGGVFNLGGPIESGPCNARANASALVGIANMLQPNDPMRAKLVEAAVRLVGDSTSATAAALEKSQISWFGTNTTTAANTAVKPVVPDPRNPVGIAEFAMNVPGVYVGNDPIVIQRVSGAKK